MPPEVSVSELIKDLLEVNTTNLTRFTNLLEKLEGDLLAVASSAIQGEIEELLRIILTICNNSIVTLLALQQTLQTRIIESFFPAQD
jgi:hypothetical protein